MPDAFASPPSFTNKQEERTFVKQRLAAAYRIFAMLGYDEGAAGHITARDPEFPDRFWVNPVAMDYAQIRASDLSCVSHEGEVIEGYSINPAAFAIHSQIHQARPDVIAVAHSHSIHGKAFSTLGRLLDPINQESCAFYEDHGLYDCFGGAVLESEEAERIGAALGSYKAVILRNHGLLTVGESVDVATWWYINMERCCQAQLLAEAAGKPTFIDHETAQQTRAANGLPIAAWFNAQAYFQRVIREHPEVCD